MAPSLLLFRPGSRLQRQFRMGSAVYFCEPAINLCASLTISPAGPRVIVNPIQLFRGHPKQRQRPLAQSMRLTRKLYTALEIFESTLGAQ